MNARVPKRIHDRKTGTRWPRFGLPRFGRPSFGRPSFGRPRARRAMGHSEVLLKILVGGVLGAEMVGGCSLLLLGALTNFNALESPIVSSLWMLTFAVAGSVISLRYLPPFSRDRGRIADFLISPKELGGSIGFRDALRWEPTDPNPIRRRPWTTARYGSQTNH